MKHFFIGRTAWISFLISLVFLAWTGGFFKESFWLGIVFIIIAIILIAVWVFHPLFYVIDKNGIRIYYIFFLKEEFLWKKVEKVYVDYDYESHTRSIPFVYDTFCIIGNSENKREYFFMESKIPRTVRGRVLIEKYTGKRIEGFLFDDIKAWFRRDKKKNKGIYHSKKYKYKRKRK